MIVGGHISEIPNYLEFALSARYALFQVPSAQCFQGKWILRNEMWLGSTLVPTTGPLSVGNHACDRARYQGHIINSPAEKRKHIRIWWNCFPRQPPAGIPTAVIW